MTDEREPTIDPRPLSDTAAWTAVRAIQLMNEAGRERDAALAALDRVRKVIAERRTEVAEREPDGMLPFGTPGAAWCDAVTVTCDRIEDALKAFPSPALAESPAHNAGPSVAECAEADRRWPLEKAGE